MSGQQKKETDLGVGPVRRTWDKEEYAARARERDREEKERAQEAEELMRKGKKPPRRKFIDMPKPTELMQQREGPLELEKNLNKTMIVETGGTSGRRGPGFYCELCNQTCKDSAGYLDHINGRFHLRRLGQTTQVARSTIEQVRAKIARLREETANRSNKRTYDFDQRLREIREQEEREREEMRARRKKEREQKRAAAAQANGGGQKGVEEDEMAAMMGFSGFGTTRR